MMGKDNISENDISTMVEIVSDTKNIEDAIGRIKGDKTKENRPKQVEVVQTSSGTKPVPVPQGKNYMENDAWFCSQTQNQEVENKFIRAKGHLEYKEWYEAERKFNEILTIEPDNAGAHMGVFLAKKHMVEVKKIGEKGAVLDLKKEKELLNAYMNGNENQRMFIEKALESRVLQNRYSEGLNKMKSMRVNSLEEAEKIFIELGDYLDASDMAKKCREEIQKVKIINEAGKLLALSRDSDASPRTIKESLNRLKELRKDNADIVGSDLDDSIEELEKLAKEIKKDETRLANDTKFRNISHKWLTVVAVFMMVVLIPLGTPTMNVPYVVKDLFAYFPASIGAREIWVARGASGDDIPYIFSLKTGDVKIVCSGSYVVQDVILPFADSVEVSIIKGINPLPGESIYSVDRGGAYRGEIGRGAVFPEKMTTLSLNYIEDTVVEVPEGTKQLYINDSIITELILPESLEYLNITESYIEQEIVVPEGCTNYSIQLIEEEQTE